MKQVAKFKDRLRLAMEIERMSNSELSYRSDLSLSLISKYLSGVSKAGSEKLFTLARVLNVNPVWLLGFDVSMRNDTSEESINYVRQGYLNRIKEIIERQDEKALETMLIMISSYDDAVNGKKKM